jgi:hypothetical protein
MYTEKSVAQAMSAINERLHVPGTKSRPQLDGWVEKNGRFAMTVTTKVRWRFDRRTSLYGRAERQGGITYVEGTVSGGVGRDGQIVIFGALLIIALLTLSQGNAILAIVAVLAGLALFIPMRGDYNNSEILLSELQKALNAKFTPPKKDTPKRATSGSTTKQRS